ACAQADPDPGREQAHPPRGQRLGVVLLAGDARGQPQLPAELLGGLGGQLRLAARIPGKEDSRSCPPSSWVASNRVTTCPRSAALIAASSPAGPAPTTATLRRRRSSTGLSTSSVS